MKSSIVINGMMCEHCAMRVTKALKSIDGVEKVEVDLASKTASVVSEDVTTEQLKNIIEEAGYEVVTIE